MRYSIYLFVLLLFPFLSKSVSAQLIIDTAHIDYTRFKGKLLVINEMHGVDANNTVYTHIVEEISKVALPGDTINLIIERPFSNAFLMNKYISEGYPDSTINLPSYTRALSTLKVPIKVIGVDFEYDQGKRGDAYLLFLKNMLAVISEVGVAIEPLKKYIEHLRKDTVWQHPEGKKELINYYQRELRALAPGTLAYKSLSELVFTLKADHFITGRARRDRINYSRLLKANAISLVKFKGNYNILIHGAQHTDPTRRRNIYSHFSHKRSSPFRKQCFSISQVYVECLSKGDYFHKVPVIESSGLFTKHKMEQKLIGFVTNKYANILPMNSTVCFNEVALPSSLPYKKTNIACWFIQWHTK